ncbi:MAG: universal stress protein [Microlunatus sp.]|nr:universal stress protein [Microlunatus sp.]
MNDPVIVVGVTPGQPDIVIRHAAKLARKLSGRIICAYVDTGQMSMFEGADGTLMAMPLDPDIVEEPTPFPDTLKDKLNEVCTEKQVQVEFRRPLGEPAIALAELAEHEQAYMIMVGTRRPGIRAGIAEFFGGSVAAHLSHRQPRPVIVIPLTPTEHGELPWDETD